MKRTARLITTIAAIVLTLVIMSVGIYAATQISIKNEPNKIKFNAVDVAATVSITKEMTGDATPTELAIPGTSSTDPDAGKYVPTFEQGKTYEGEITIGDIVFPSTSATFTLTTTITNNLSAAAINVKYTATTSDTNEYVVITTNLTNDGTAVTDYNSTTGINVATSKTLTITTTITLTTATDKLNTILDAGLDIPFDFSLVLTRVAA